MNTPARPVVKTKQYQEVVEVDVAVNLRGPLAKSLLSLSGAMGVTPVNALADIVKSALSLKERQHALRMNSQIWDGIALKAKSMGTTRDELAARLLKTIVEDDLFSAVLDQ